MRLPLAFPRGTQAVLDAQGHGAGKSTTRHSVLISVMTPHQFVSGFKGNISGCEWRGQPLGCQYAVPKRDSDLHMLSGGPHGSQIGWMTAVLIRKCAVSWTGRQPGTTVVRGFFSCILKCVALQCRWRLLSWPQPVHGAEFQEATGGEIPQQTDCSHDDDGTLYKLS